MGEETTASVLALTRAKHQAVLEWIDAGFCVLALGDQRRVLEVNPGFERHAGLPAVIGEPLDQLAPELASSWAPLCDRVAATGEHEHVELTIDKLGRVFDVHAFRVGAPADRQVGVLFVEISQRKQAEQAQRESEDRKAFLLRLSDALRPLYDPVEIELTAAQTFGEQLGAQRVFYSEIVAQLDELVRGRAKAARETPSRDC